MAEYRKILFSTGVIALGKTSASAFMIVNSKLIAFWGGVEGFGIYSLLKNLCDWGNALGNFGLSNSSVRDIAEANASKQVDAVNLKYSSVVLLSVLIALTALAIWFGSTNQ